MGLINAFGMYWRRDSADWTLNSPRLDGMSQAGNCAYATVYAFIMGVAPGWPMQWIASRFWTLPNCGDARDAQTELEYFHVSDCFRDNDDKIAAHGTAGGMVIGAAALIVLFFVLSSLSSGSPNPDQAKTSGPTAVKPSRGASPTAESSDTRVPSAEEE